MAEQTAGVTGRFREMFLTFQLDSIEAETQSLLGQQVSAKEVMDVCKACFEDIGQKFEAGEYYLPQLVIAGEMFKKVSALIEATVCETTTADGSGTIVLGTPRGDIHDLGKNIFAVLARASGFSVIDLGVDVKPEAFIEKVRETGAGIIGMSCLLTTTYPAIQELVDRLGSENLRESVDVIIGGGATDRGLVEKLKVDAQTCDAYEGLRFVQEFVKKRRRG